MALQMKFRGAFNGFHREDVVNYIARMNHDHEAQVNGLKNELGMLNEELAAEREKTAMLLAEINGLRAKAEEKQAQEELELFRQAERVQRESEAQVARAYEKAETVLGDALEMAGASAARVEELSQALDRLRQALEAGSARLREETL